jgi:hypothetical protein
MKTKLFLYFAMMLMWQNVIAADFSAVAPSGQTMYYNIVNGKAELTYPGYSWDNFTKPTGNLTIPENVVHNGVVYEVAKIGQNALYNCSGLTSVTIPRTVTSIFYNSFWGCTGLTSVAFNADSCGVLGGSPTYYSPFDGTSLTSMTFGNNVKVIPSCLCKNKPNLTTIIIPDSVRTIGSSAFEGCSGLSSITIGKSVSYIGNNAFKNCSNLTSVAFNADSCTYAGSTYYSSSESTCPYVVFKNCPNITSFNFGNNVKIIPANLCYGLSGLASITIPRAVKSIGDWAFGYCSGLISVSFNADSCGPPLGVGAFTPKPTFVNCPNITSFTFGNNVKVIPTNLCMNLSSLTSVNIPDSVTSIEYFTFYGCSGLTSITCNAVIPPTVANANAFYNVSRSIPLRVPIASVSSYQSASVWNEFTNCIGIGGYIITATSANPTMGTVSGGGRYATGATAMLTATPNPGYHFVQWQDGNTQNPRTITVTGDATYTATFAPDAAPATVTATISQIAATSAYAEIVMGQQTSYFYLIYAPQSVFTQNGLITDEAIISYVNQHYGSSDRNYSNVSGYMNDLTPNTTYQLVVVPYNSNGEVGMVCWEQFTTLNETDPATVTATISEVTATSAYAEIVMGQQTSYFYLIYAPQSVFTQNGLTTDEAIISYVNQNYGSSDRNYNNVSGYMNDLTPNTTYMLVVVPYNSNDEVGTITRKQFTTLNTNGIESRGEETYAVSSWDGRLMVSGAEGNMVNVYSLDGRCIYSASAKGTTVIDIPAPGTYLLKIGHHPARKVVVIR